MANANRLSQANTSIADKQKKGIAGGSELCFRVRILVNPEPRETCISVCY